MQRPICVLSVGRSGSSLATRALNLLGVHLGDAEDLFPASPQNEAGFWESMSIYRLNERLLESLGGSWYRPPALAPGWAHDERLQGLREEAARLVEQLAAPGRRWGFKDPRTIVLLEFWRLVVGDSGMDYVICVRQPQAVIRSVQATGLAGTDPRDTARLWMDMNAAALVQTSAERRVFVFYEDWFENPGRVSRQLASFLHGEAAAAGSDALKAVDALVSPQLRRADAKEESSADAADLDPELEVMYEHLRLAATNHSDELHMRDRQARLAGAVADGYRRRHSLEQDLQRLEARVAASSGEIEMAREEVRALKAAREELQTELLCQRRWLGAMQASRSWRMTAPLRAAKRRVRVPSDRS